MVKYLIRLDDANPGMAKEKWHKMECLLDNYSIKPVVGVIPNNQSKTMAPEPEDEHFWETVKQWENKGWIIAMHGYSHVYMSKSGGVNPFWDRSEFAGLPLEIQRDKIKMGISVFKEKGIFPNVFYAPSHTFDAYTLIALEKETEIRVISDTVALSPYEKESFVFIPQFIGRCRKMMISGIYTFCYHPNRMKDDDFYKLERFIEKYHSHFIGFNDLNLTSFKSKRGIDRFASWLFFLSRKIRN